MTNNRTHTSSGQPEPSNRDELTRFENNRNGEVYRGPAWRTSVNLGTNPQECLDRILTITRIVISVPHGTQLSDTEWARLLPKWFLDKTPTFSKKEAEAMMASTPKELWHTLPWDFGSWLDAIQAREWQWWSYNKVEDKLAICLSLSGWPAMLEAFEHMLTTAGGSIIESSEVS